MPQNKVMVYGTLKKGFGNHWILKNSKFIGSVTTAPLYSLYDCGFPLLKKNGQTAIRGEIYEVSRKTLSMMDQLEHNGTMYNREPIEIPGHENVQAYFWMHSIKGFRNIGDSWNGYIIHR